MSLPGQEVGTRPSTPGTPQTPASMTAPSTPATDARYAATRAELNKARARIQELEAELADFSSQVMEEANNQVGNANRRVAEYTKKNTALKAQIDERDILIDNQKEQLDVLKQMITQMDPKEYEEAKETVRIPVENGQKLERALEYAVWSPTVTPTYRYDSHEYEQFLKIKVPIEDEQWFKKTLTSWKFAAQTIEHEVEPTLNISVAPHMSWLARRAFSAAVQDGSLEIQPISSDELVWASRPSNPCCFCGRNSSQPQYARLHIIKIPKDTQSYPVGNECVIRIRFACEYLGFLRSIFSGLRKIDTVEAQHAAWSECIRLRQQLFWARAGGFWALPQSPENKNHYLTLEALDDEALEDAVDTAAPSTPKVSSPTSPRVDRSKEPYSPKVTSPRVVSSPSSPKSSQIPPAEATPSEKVAYPTHADATPSSPSP